MNLIQQAADLGGPYKCDQFALEKDLVDALSAPQTIDLNVDMKLPKVAVLMCTYQGQHYLAEQLDSIALQSHTNWDLYVSDDGSKDGTHAILDAYKYKWPSGRLSVHRGPAKGFASNFLSLTCDIRIKADYFAYSDQDDIWESNKLERAIKWIETIPQFVPALYCSRTRLVDKDNNEIGLSPKFSKSPSFSNALIQNVGGGNTIVFNNATRSLLREAGSDLSVVSHDWWLYILVSGCGGCVFYDSTPTLRYRQHSENLVGMNASWSARLVRIRMLLQGQLRNWNDSNIAAVSSMSHRLTPQNRETLKQFSAARKKSLFPRLFQLKRSGVHRHTLFDNLGLIVAAIFRKI